MDSKKRTCIKIHLCILFFLYCIPIRILANTHHVGIAFSASGYDLSTKQIIDGINLAKIYFEKKYPKENIQLKSYKYYSHNLESVTNAAYQICKDKIPIVIGGEMSEEAMVLGDILNKCRIILISPTATNPLVTTNKPFVFTMNLSDRDVANRVVDFTYYYLGNPLVGVIDDVSLPHPHFLATTFIKRYSQLSNNKLIVSQVLKEENNYSNQVSLFMKRHVSVVIMLTYDVDFKKFIAEAVTKKYFPIYVGSDGWGSNPSLIKMFKQLNIVAYKSTYWKEEPRKFVKTFKNLYLKYYSNPPNQWNAIGFDAGLLVFKILLEQKEKVSANELANKLSSIKNIELVTSKNFYYKLKEPQKAVYMYRITKEGANFVKTL